MAKLWVAVDTDATRAEAESVVDRLTGIVDNGGSLSFEQNQMLDENQEIIGGLDDMSGVMIQVDQNELTVGQRSDLGSYWNDVKAGLEGRPTSLIGRWEGRTIAGYKLLADENKLYQAANAGELDFEDLYEE
jgi:hypothetical protein